MSAIVTDGKLLLSATATGFATAKKQLPVAPAGADALVFYFRAFTEGFADNEDANYGWDNAACLGLSFDGSFPTYDGDDGSNKKQNFFGLVSALAGAGSPNVFAEYTEAPDGEGWQGPITRLFHGFLLGKSSEPNLWQPIGVNSLSLPNGATHGQTFTGVWIVRKAAAQNIVVSIGHNFESLALENISQALVSKATVWRVENSATQETTRWRPSEAVMAFPTHFLAKFCGGQPGTRLVIDHFKAEYWKYNA